MAYMLSLACGYLLARKKSRLRMPFRCEQKPTGLGLQTTHTEAAAEPCPKGALEGGQAAPDACHFPHRHLSSFHLKKPKQQKPRPAHQVSKAKIIPPNTNTTPTEAHFAFFSPSAVARTLNASNMSSAAT
jgi:hypothetical protein